MKRTIEVDDVLADCVQKVKDGILEALHDYLNDNPDTTEAPCISNDLDYSGRISELVDGAVPIYTRQIDTAHFLYGDDLEQAYEDAGIGDGNETNWKAVAIYCYLDQEGRSWYEDNKDELYDAWREAHPLPAEEDEDETEGEPETTDAP